MTKRQIENPIPAPLALVVKKTSNQRSANGTNDMRRKLDSPNSPLHFHPRG
jgi:hypothetical protein